MIYKDFYIGLHYSQSIYRGLAWAAEMHQQVKQSEPMRSTVCLVKHFWWCTSGDTEAPQRVHNVTDALCCHGINLTKNHTLAVNLILGQCSAVSPSVLVLSERSSHRLQPPELVMQTVMEAVRGKHLGFKKKHKKWGI